MYVDLKCFTHCTFLYDPYLDVKHTELGGIGGPDIFGAQGPSQLHPSSQGIGNAHFIKPYRSPVNS